MAVGYASGNVFGCLTFIARRRGSFVLVVVELEFGATVTLRHGQTTGAKLSVPAPPSYLWDHPGEPTSA